MPIELPPGTAAESDENPPVEDGQLLQVIGVVVGLVLAIILLLFWVSNQIVWWIPPQVEVQLGRLMAQELAQAAEDSPRQQALAQLLDRLEDNLPVSDQRDFEVLLVDREQVNALALPGQQMVVFTGLLEVMESENELAMVLGHELGHFINRDHLRTLTRQLTLNLILVSIFPDTAGLQSLAVSGVRALSSAQFSQQQEQRADEFGLEVLMATYGHVNGATDFFQRMQEDQPGNAFAFLQSHPNPGDRVDYLQNLIATREYPLQERTPLSETLKTNT
ncbi:MAG: M48 family metallopeptidase [Synechococcaceae cyanobacterium SM2_3_1]|nr:M48 family metallopeptidase [Synechococcaceae cyanobacterium SM2_3_1]